jgi:hypothetical protein
MFFTIVLGVLALGATSAGASKKNDDGVHKVTICHRTGSNANPYNVITIDFSAANGGFGKGGNDHSHHDGPVWNPTLKADHIKWGDIIPPFTYDGGSFPGLNWAEGQAISENGCAPVTTTPPPAPCPQDPSIPASDPDCVPCPTNPAILVGDPLCNNNG